MGIVYAEIKLKNAGDEVRLRDGHIAKNDVRETTVKAMVDTGTGTLVIDEAIREKLGLETKGLRGITLAGGTKVTCKVTETVTICWKDRESDCRALVLPGEGDVLLGVIPLEDMDLIVSPAKQALVGAHGDDWITRV
jgi:clan AA aspartic protease